MSKMFQCVNYGNIDTMRPLAAPEDEEERALRIEIQGGDGGYAAIDPDNPDTIEQALERAGTGEGNKGFDAAMTALDMLAVVREVDALADVPGGQ